MQSKIKKMLRDLLSKYVVYTIFVLSLAVFGIWLGGNFFSVSNLLNITRQSGAIVALSVGMVFIIGMGHIDLSIGSIIAVTSLIIAMILRDTDNILLAMLAALGIGAFVGLFNGLCVTRIHMPAFLTTLGTQSVLTGIAMWLTNTKAIPVTNNNFLYWFGAGKVFGVIPILFLWALVATAIGHVALKNTAYGRKVLAVGGNRIAASYSGVNVKRIEMTAFIVMGMLAGLSGALYAGRTQAARWDFGSGVEMNVIAAVVLGGTAMSGGNGSVIGAMIGSFLIMMINNGLVIGGLGTAQQTLMQGVIILIAVALSELGKMRKR
jgi:ribose transport system permease protein